MSLILSENIKTILTLSEYTSTIAEEEMNVIHKIRRYIYAVLVYPDVFVVLIRNEFF